MLVNPLTDIWGAKRLLRMRRRAAASFCYFFHSPQKQDGQSDKTTVHHLWKHLCLIYRIWESIKKVVQLSSPVKKMNQERPQLQKVHLSKYEMHKVWERVHSYWRLHSRHLLQICFPLPSGAAAFYYCSAGSRLLPCCYLSQWEKHCGGQGLPNFTHPPTLCHQFWRLQRWMTVETTHTLTYAFVPVFWSAMTNHFH